MKSGSEIAGHIVLERKENNIKVYAVVGGIRKTNCSSATQLFIDKLQPDFVIDSGVAGSLTKEVNIYDIVCAKHSYEDDPCSGKELGQIPSEKNESCKLISDSFYKKAFLEFCNHIQETICKPALQKMFPVLKEFIFGGRIKKF